MIRILVLAMLAAFLCGCRPIEVPVWETVTDDVLETASYMEDAYTITLGVPKDAVEDEVTRNRRVYRHVDGDYKIYTQVYLAASPESAVRQLTGFEMEQLCVIETTRFGLPEYRFTWYDAEETALCRADLLIDETVCYAVVFAVQESAGGAYNQLVTEVFSTFGLYFDEGV